MQDYKVNLRIKTILLRICNENNYVTIASIAKDLEISTKTVVREIPEVERWLKLNGCSLDKKTGVGIRFKGSSEDKNAIINLLEETLDDKIYSPLERKSIIISELLQSKEPVKLYNFTKILKVTESTISNDLDKADNWFSKYDLNLIRRPGYGVYVEGQENNKRKAIVSLIYENTNENQMLELIRNNDPDTVESDITTKVNSFAKTRLLNLIDSKIIKKLETLIYEVQKTMDYKLADNAYIGLIVHLALVIKRISKNADIKIDREILKELEVGHDYLIAKKLAEDISEAFSIKVSEDEIGYITMHIKGSKNQDTNNKYGNKTLGNFELVRLSKEIIKVAESETGCFLEQDEKLLIGLVNHLGPALSRLKMNLDIRNPLLEEIKEHYPDLIKVSEKCVKILEGYIGIDLPESEIAYIAMHIGAAIENSGVFPRHIYRVVLACAAGIGTSMILATRIEKECDNIQIVETISTIRIEEEWLREEEIEFIISTVKIDNCSIPVVTVNPLLFEEDKNKIINLIKILKNNNPQQIGRSKKSLNFKEKLIKLNSYGEGIIDILNNFFLEEDNDSESIKEINLKISKIAGNPKSPEKEEKLKAALSNREEKGSIVITGHEAILFHCRTDSVDKLYFGALKIGRSISLINGRDEVEDIKLGVIMLAPEGCSKNHIEVISYVSKMLIEKPSFLEALKFGDKEEAFNELSNILKEFYKLKVNN
jgi:mannitol operon transcriptional antiterminator